MQKRRPVMLAILDGWGWRDDPADNAIRLEVDGIGAVKARYAVAADGMWSVLRKCLGASDESGYLGEWELTATVTADGSTTPNGYSGPLSIKHVGLCTQDGPEEKSGKIRVQMLPSESSIEATLWVDGVECSYRGILSDFYIGIMDCSGSERVPLKLWIKESK